MTTAIQVNELSKRYRIGATQSRFRYGMLRDVMAGAITAPVRFTKTLLGRSKRVSNSGEEKNYIWALDNISFELEEGKVLGIIGRNGAGKSTLLKILSRVTEPTRGSVSVRGRVGSLLEVGTGFHPELTGRENIYLNGAILGMKRTEIDSKFDEMVEFSEVTQFIDTPVKRYSSGMYLRLAFAVAAHLEPEILVVDEVLAVGDAEFQKKCLGKMGDVARQGRTVLFVSHNMSAILRLSEEAIVLNHGKMILRAPTQEAVDYYLSSGMTRAGQRTWEPEEIPAESSPFRPVCLMIKNALGKVVDTVRSTEDSQIVFEYCLDTAVTGLRIGFYLSTMRGEYVMTSFDTDEPELFEQYSTRKPGCYTSSCTLPADFLNEGRYSLGINASSFGVRRYFQDETALAFNVDISGAPGTQWPEPRQGSIRPRLKWKIEKKD
jgi:lipopolysaccharide transport system ATP-binding protein